MTDHEQKYQGEQARRDLAVRLLRHEARTHIITRCTGFSQDQIRKLWSRYFSAPGAPGRVVRRHRGRSPSSIEFFVRNPLLQAEASLLAHVFANWGLLEILPDLSTQPVPLDNELELGERFCDAFEEFRAVSPGSDISFEHAWSLLAALTERHDLLLLDCAECRAFYVQDALALDSRRCPACRIIRRGRRRGRPKRAPP
ncbi:hypothetical protein [Thioalkalivibrio sp. XN279]|uniref:hypothetical protein n=1 Tax=Thioalkalivibrio sp. XN279 TaxID=2714953 RepID=UPI0014099872|nr:hypothetical protein [Thioalkalivibrio sp. XN279]NHA13824.1 hypothetical protein [Thioalkalivibrio sp. XN279]